MLTVKLRKGKTKRIKQRHLWIFRGDLNEKIPRGIPAGPVLVEDHAGRFACIGDYDPGSNIAVRVLSWKKLIKIDEEFFRKRILKAYEYRKVIYPDETSYRMIFSEGDFLPGLIIDKYGDYLAVQLLTEAMKNRKEKIYNILIDIFSPKGIVNRVNRLSNRIAKTNTGAEIGYGDVPEKILIKDGELSFYVDLLKGEKTGYFLDQRINHRSLNLISKKKKVLDIFSYTGGFAIHSGYYGASHVTAVEVSRNAVELGIENVKLNGLSNKIEFINDNAFDYLKNESLKKNRYDLIILDPPAFAKDKYSIEDAYRGYKEINLRAFNMLNPGGFLVSCSCSYNFLLPDFLSMLRDAASDTGKTVRIMKISGQSLDHPVCLSVPETNYLKAVFAMVIE